MDEARVELCVENVRGVLGLEAELLVDVTIHASGFSDGATVMLLVTGSLSTDSGTSHTLGKADPVVEQVGWPSRSDRVVPPRHAELRWRLSAGAIERLEQARRGGSVHLGLTFEYVLLASGKAEPQWTEPHRPLRSGTVERHRLEAHRWASAVLQAWRQAVAVSVVVTLPTSATPEHRVVIERLEDAQRKLDLGEYRASIQDARSACEQLREMHDEIVNRPRERTLDEREANILDHTRQLIQALHAYDSAASHVETHLRDIRWQRDHAEMALAQVAAVAQRIFSSGA